MRLVNYVVDGRRRVGRVVDGRVDDLSARLATAQDDGPTSVDDLLTDAARWDAAVEVAGADMPSDAPALEDVRLLPPVLRPSKILVAGANTWSHLRESEPFTGAIAPLRPMVLSKPPSALNDPVGTIEHPPHTTQLDYEVELAVVIGRRARNIPAEDALAHVAGATVANDVSARDVQLSVWEDNEFFRTHYLGKAFDGFCPLGPALVTLDELGDLGALELRSLVNGEIRQSERASDLVFDVAQLVAYISSIMTLEPGDVILTGSPEGVGYFHPGGMLSIGDVVRCEIGGIGAIEHRIVAPADVTPPPTPLASPSPRR